MSASSLDVLVARRESPHVIDPAGGAADFDAWVLLDLDAAHILRGSPAGLGILGVVSSELPIGLDATVDLDDGPAFVDDRLLPSLRAGQVWKGELRLGPAGGARRLMAVTAVPHAVAARAENLEHATLFLAPGIGSNARFAPDPLTGLPTRSTLLARLDDAVQRTRATDRLVAALFLDLDGLKKINDRYGHEVGDGTLVETARRISSCLGDDHLAARFGGDEFVVLCEAIESTDQAAALAGRILATLGGVDHYQAISASIGVAVSRGGEIDGPEMLRRADTAMYRAKARGGSRVAVFDQAMQNRQRADQAMRSSLLQAIANDGFSVAAQPIFELGTGRIIGVELFIRLRDGAPYIANAGDLFRLAHEHGEAIDRAILARAIELAGTWQETLGSAAPRLHVNVSAQSLAAAQFTSRVDRALRDQRVPRGAIAMEIDSRDLAPAGDRERRTILGLRDLGVPVVIDGYGGDALALRDVADWKPAMVKIATGDLSPRVLTGMVRGLSSLRVATCLKGVENQQMLDVAVAIGAFAGQGNALTSVRQVARIDRQLRGPQRLGF